LTSASGAVGAAFNPSGCVKPSPATMVRALAAYGFPAAMGYRTA
jgi:hypothetical protein